MVIDGGVATSDLLALQRDRLKPYIITNCCSEDDVLEKTQNVIGLGDCQLSLKRRPNAGLARGSEHKGDFVR